MPLFTSYKKCGYYRNWNQSCFQFMLSHLISLSLIGITNIWYIGNQSMDIASGCVCGGNNQSFSVTREHILNKLPHAHGRAKTHHNTHISSGIPLPVVTLLHGMT